MPAVRVARGMQSGAIALFAVLLAWSVPGCGSTDSTAQSGTVHESPSGMKAPDGSIEACLQKGGATLASSTADLDFLRDAENSEEVSKSGFTFDREARMMVEVWSASTFEREPPAWFVWIGQPIEDYFEDQKSLEEVVKTEGEGYVYFLTNSRRSGRQSAANCITFSGQGDRKQVTIDPTT